MSPRRKQQHRMQHNVSLPAWSDAPELVKDGVLHVSIHVPAWGATTEFLAMRLPTMFQSTFPRGERHTANHGCLFWEMFQSTLPRGERPCVIFLLDIGVVVSIHAPAWGATHYVRKKTENRPKVSIHAPAWGATFAALKSFLVEPLFQSTLPRGERPSNK